MHTGLTEDELTQAIEQGDDGLVQMALGLCEIRADHLVRAQAIPCPQARLAICRMLVRRGANPHEGTPSPMDLATSRGLEDEAWSMAAAWLDYQSITRWSDPTQHSD